MVAARVLATAFDWEGKAAMAFPKFGGERRGAPVSAFSAFNDKPIRQKTQLYHPDCLIVIDPQLMNTVNVFEGINAGAVLIINTPGAVSERYHPNLSTVGAVDATWIALQEIGRPITNTSMLGAFARTTGWVKLESVLEGLGEYFNGPALEKNIRCVRRAYEETGITTF